MKSFIKEFKEFALKGNVVDLAIGVLIGGAFSSLVTEVTTDIITPIINIFGNAQDKIGLVIPLPGGSEGLQIGALIGAIINFIILALVVFLIMKAMNKLSELGKKEEEVVEEAPKGPTTEELLVEIRDLLKEK